MADRIEQEFGPINVRINNAMAATTELSPEDFLRGTEVIYLGQVQGTMAVLRRMTPRNRGTVVDVGSALAYRAIR